MRTLFLRLALATAALLALGSMAATASAASSSAGSSANAAIREEEPLSAGTGAEIEPVAIWSFIVVLLACGAGGVFYLLKKRMGGFPANPAWTAPIEIMRSSTFPDENTYGDAPADHGHGGYH